MNPGMRMDHIRWMSGRVWVWAISTGLAACALVWAHTAEAQEAECRNGQGLKCWFIIGEAYKAPKRVAFIARHADRGAVDGKRAAAPAERQERCNGGSRMGDPAAHDATCDGVVRSPQCG